MSNLDYDIQELYIEGHSAKMIAAMLECPVELVLGAIASMGVKDVEDEEIYSPYQGA
jgi:hypothetical protein